MAALSFTILFEISEAEKESLQEENIELSKQAGECSEAKEKGEI